MRKKRIITVALLIAVSLIMLASTYVQAQTQPAAKQPLSSCLDLSLNGKPIEMKMDAFYPFTGFDVFIQPITYGDFTSYDDLTKAFAPGNGAALFSSEALGGNITMATHSGYHHSAQLLPGEAFRSYLEGGIVSSDKSTMILYDSGTRERKMASLIGKTMAFNQDGCKLTLRLEADAYIPHEDVGVFSNDSQTILQVVLNTTTGSTHDDFVKAISGPQQYLIMYFCGWGSVLAYPNWPIWAEHVQEWQVLSPDNTTPTP